MTTPKRSEFDSVVEQNLARVYRLALRLVGSSADADDVAQDVFIEAYRTHNTKTTTIQNWPAYLTRLVTHRCIDHLRKRRRQPSAFREDVEDKTTEPVALLEAKEMAHWLRSEIATLPDQQSLVFTLMCIEEHTREEVAEIAGISAEAVSTSLYKARKKLEQRLNHWQKGATNESR